ncbi:MAG: nuclease [Planctomycetia bacterium]|nr:nuclease [Planctomycetia bacterium]
MTGALSIPPSRKSALTSGRQLARRLSVFLGSSFHLTGKQRTDGSHLRKRIAEVLEQSGALPAPAADGSWRILPPKKKGVPRLLREFIDTYIVTTGSSYNLQVWNRNPSEPTPHVELTDGSLLRACDVRFVITRIDVAREIVRSVIVATPEYIVSHFGKFGKPTIKEQLIILPRVRQEVLALDPPILFYADLAPLARQFRRRISDQSARIHDVPSVATTLRIEAIRDFVKAHLLGRRINPDATKNRGQQLEQIVASGLGYDVKIGDLLIGGFPDIRHQALEVKVQDAPTVDLGRYSPQFAEPLDGCPGFSTQDVRYLIALTDPSTGVCRGAVICPGKYLGQHFVYVANESFKCQRSIPMAFFDRFDGRAVFNPPYP